MANVDYFSGCLVRKNGIKLREQQEMIYCLRQKDLVDFSVLQTEQTE
jgi:hypothetical protein